MFSRLFPSICAATAALIVICVPEFASAEEAQFQATAVRTSLSKDQAGYFISTMSGEAVGFGGFDGVARIKCKGHHCRGSVILDFGGGNTLEFFTDVKFDTHYQFAAGTCVITGGTGAFDSASGAGYFSVDERFGGVNAVITWDGTIDY